MLGIIVAILYFIFGIFTTQYFIRNISMIDLELMIRKINKQINDKQFNHLKHIIYFWSILLWPGLIILIINNK